MGDCQAHRCANAIGLPQVISCDKPFSCYEYLESLFDVDGFHDSVHWCFALARIAGAKVVVQEQIEIVGALKESCEAIASIPGASLGDVCYRISFWSESFHEAEAIANLCGDQCIGYVLLQKSGYRKRNIPFQWKVWEAVIRSAHQEDWFVCAKGRYDFRVAGNNFAIDGFLYCQQDGITTVCAHVALRSLLSAISPNHDVRYAEIDKIARQAGEIDLKQGLTVSHIEKVLEEFGRKFGFDYDDFYFDPMSDATHGTARDPKRLPYFRLLHAGVESGRGSLFGFSLKLPVAGVEDSQHIIPVFGHTFDGLSWNKSAEDGYFTDCGLDRGALSGNSWVGGLLAHDDNVGANVFLPRNCVAPCYVSYVVNILKPGYYVSGYEVEDRAEVDLHEHRQELFAHGVGWNSRLNRLLIDDEAKVVDERPPTRVVYRALALTKDEYVSHLRAMTDWKDQRETEEILGQVLERLSPCLWVVEFSAESLFCANRRKVGEIVYSSEVFQKDSVQDPSNAIHELVRVPGMYHIRVEESPGAVREEQIPSLLVSHTPCYCNCG